MIVRKIRQKQLRVSDLALLLVIFEWHHGGEGVNNDGNDEDDAVVIGTVAITTCNC